jgi:hypothetical protein
VLPHLQQNLLLRVLLPVELLEVATVELLQATRHLKTVMIIRPLVSLNYAHCGLILQLHHMHLSPGKLISLGNILLIFHHRKFSVIDLYVSNY